MHDKPVNEELIKERSRLDLLICEAPRRGEFWPEGHFWGQHYVVKSNHQALIPRVAYMAMPMWIAHVFKGDFEVTGLALDMRFAEVDDAATRTMLLDLKIDQFIQGFIGHKIWLWCFNNNFHYGIYLPNIVMKALDVLCFTKHTQLTTQDEQM